MRYKNKHITSEIEKVDLIMSISRENREMLFLYDEDPIDYLSEQILFQKLDEKKFIIRPPYSYEDLTKWLYLGNWQAVTPAIQSYKFVDSFRSPHEYIMNHLANHKIDIMIDSFHDDIEWNVFRKG